MRDLYADLGLTPSATADEIRQAYKRIAATEHPDRAAGRRRRGETVDPDVFLRASLAYEVLIDPCKRAEYDALRTAAVRGQVDPQKIKDFMERTMADLAPELSALRGYALNRNWLGVAVSTVSVGASLWSLGGVVKGLKGLWGKVVENEPAPKAERKALAKRGTRK